jgi:acyl-CoA thioesterase
MNTEDRHLNGHGSVHGGVLASLADIAMGAVVNAKTPQDAAPVTVSLVMTYLEPAPPGPITATGTITRQGKRLTITGAEITDGDGVTVATALATFTTA